MLKRLFTPIICALMIQAVQAQKLPELIPYNDHGKWGYADTMGIVKIPLLFSRSYPFIHEYAVVAYNKPKETHLGGSTSEYNIIDKKGNCQLSKNYESIYSTPDGTSYIVESNNLHGVLDQNLNLTVPCIYDNIHPYQGDLARVDIFGYYGIIDQHGEVIVPCKYRFIYPFREGLACFASIDGNSSYTTKYGYFDKTGKIVIDPQYDEAGSFFNGYAYVKQDKQHMRINSAGKVMSTYDYDQIEPVTDGIAIVRKAGKTGFINSEGVEIVPCIYEDAIPFNEGYGCLKQGKSWFYIDKTGKRAFPGDFSETYPFSEGLAMVVNQNKCGFIDTSGRLISDYRWKDASPFHHGLSIVEIAGYYGIITKQNLFLIKPKYKGIGEFENGIGAIYPDRKQIKELGLNRKLPETCIFYIDKYGREYCNHAAR